MGDVQIFEVGIAKNHTAVVCIETRVWVKIFIEFYINQLISKMMYYSLGCC